MIVPGRGSKIGRRTAPPRDWVAVLDKAIGFPVSSRDLGHLSVPLHEGRGWPCVQLSCYGWSAVSACVRASATRRRSLLSPSSCRFGWRFIQLFSQVRALWWFAHRCPVLVYVDSESVFYVSASSFVECGYSRT